MRKFLLISLMFIVSCSVFSPLQRSKFITVSNLIDSKKFEEAKDAIDALIDDKDASKWAKTWFYRGKLCQVAYQEGKRTNNSKLYQLYPDQLFLSYDSYRRAQLFDKAGRLDRQLAPNLVLLANDFQKMGQDHYQNKRYNEALKAFEYAIRISKNTVLEVETDMNLVYNAALAAYESKEWEKAIKHLEVLHKDKYSINATHLLFDANLQNGDTLSAQNRIIEGIEKYDENVDLILLLVDLLFKTNDVDMALEIIKREINRNPTSHKLHYTKGLVYQKTHQYHKAINAYANALNLAPDDPMVLVGLAISNYNIGVDIEEHTRTITNNRIVLEQKEKSAEAFDTAIEWLDKAYKIGSDDKEVLIRIYDLYRSLRVTDKLDEIENHISLP